MPYEITQCYLPPGRGTFPPLPQPKLVLDLATPEGCKAELTWEWGDVFGKKFKPDYKGTRPSSSHSALSTTINKDWDR